MIRKKSRHRRPRKIVYGVVIAISLFAIVGPTPGRANPPAASVIVSGLATSRVEDKLRGLVLFDELGCVACHKTPASSSLIHTSKQAPRLSTVGQRVNPYYLEQFIQTPHTTKPGTTMPDMLSSLDHDERKLSAQAITHFLLSLSKRRDFNLQAIDAVAAEHGEKLFHSVGCVACHSPRNAAGEERFKKISTPLGSLEKKYNVRSLAQFLSDPHHVRPSGRMPNMQLSGPDVEKIAHYLLRKTQVPGHLNYRLLRGRVWEGLDVNVSQEKAGHVKDFDLGSLPQLQSNSAIVYDGFLKIDRAGEYTFFLELNGGQLWINDTEVANLKPSSRRGVKTLQAKSKLAKGWNKIKFVYIHTGKNPKLGFEIEGPDFARQAIPAARLSISKTPIAAHKPYRVDAALAKRGKAKFAKLGCAKCHDDIRTDIQVDAARFAPLAGLDASQGCLSDTTGRWPRFNLSSTQKALLRSALPTMESTKLDDRATINKTLVTFNCIACHTRAELGGVTPERDALFTGTKKELGNQGRIPPPLTHVGAKLQKAWAAEVLLRGKRQRPYMNTTMPQFGEANVGHLVDLFDKVDTLESVIFAPVKDSKKTKLVGHTLIGSTGFSCIACHDFNGQKAGGPGAMEIIHTTERLKKDWFYLFMLDPARFRPRIIMPAAWPNGHVFKKQLLDGDVKKQIESLWIYLEDGRRAKNPIGLSRKSPELRVADVAVICRGRGNAGYRGIAVGYPQRISLAFDSQEMSLRLLWKGDFASIDHGRFRARGHDKISFPQGIPFHRLKSLEDNWPYKRKTDYLFPQNHGYQFRGYSLDKEKRPTFMYRYGKIAVEEFFEDMKDAAGENKTAYFRRTFTFQTPQAQKKFYFRAASGRGINKKTDASFVVDGRLHVTIKGSQQAVVRDGDPQELLIPLTLPQGKSTLTLDYKW